MTDAISPPSLAAVVALKIRDFLRAPVAEQVSLKAQLQAIAELALAPAAPDSRIVLDAPDGLALVVLDGPADALGIAERLQATAGGLALCIGLDYGPVRAVDHERRGRGLVGDGLTASMAQAGATIPGRIAATRAFREALEWAVPGRAGEFVAGGNFTDASTRTHEIYTLDKRAASSRRRRDVIAGVAGIVIVLALGTAARALRPLAAPARPAVLEFDVSPRAEVLIGGVAKGTTPPLKRLEIAPGAHAVELRASGYPPLRVGVSLEAGQVVTIKHTFARPKRERTMIENLRRKFGF